MRALAEYIMRGRKQATLAVAVSTAVPLLFWLGAAALALIVLRRGLADAMPVMVWGALPALAWAFVGDLTPLLVLAGSVGLAVLLRQRSDWVPVVLAAVPLGLVYALVLMLFLAEPLQALAGQIQQLLPQMLGELDSAVLARLERLLVPLLAGLMGAVHAMMALVALMIGRSWQAGLYNPGGFRQEFHRLRLPSVAAIVLLALTVFGPQFGQLALLSPVASVPLVLAGLALVHGVVGLKGLGSAWLVVTYVLLLVFAQFAFPLIMLLAFVDSLFDFRSRMAPAQGPRNGGDSNDRD